MEDAVQLFGLFFFCAAAMETVDLLAIAVVVTTIIVSGLFYCFYAVADAVEIVSANSLNANTRWILFPPCIFSYRILFIFILILVTAFLL